MVQILNSYFDEIDMVFDIHSSYWHYTLKQTLYDIVDLVMCHLILLPGAKHQIIIANAFSILQNHILVRPFDTNHAACNKKVFP